jgi:hypothetical protein
MLQETDRFVIQSADGRRFEVIEFTDLANPGLMGDPNKPVPTLKNFITTEGLQVKSLGGYRYEIVELALPATRMGLAI